MSDLRLYEPLRDYHAVRDLWSVALPERYAVTERVLWPRIAGRNTLRAGDGWVMSKGNRLIGFGLAEIDRDALPGDANGSIQALLVDPEHRRKGIASVLLEKLESRIREEGRNTARPGGGIWRFWTGVPDDLPDARAFFERRGYQNNYAAVDLFGDLAKYADDGEWRNTLASARVEAVPLTSERFAQAYDLLEREAPSWRRSFLMMAAAGDIENILLFSHGAESVGCIQTHTPGSHWRGSNLVWEQSLGSGLGGFGAVLIAKAWRGRGLGAALCHVAASHIKAQGACGCYIDWTSEALTERLYSRVGASVWAGFQMMSRSLAT
jgi:GNAT superfamily N-acetyltransferase